MDQIEGDVNVGVFVNRAGKIEEIKLLNSSSHDELDKAALKYVQNIRFEPAHLDGQPIGAWTKLILRYRLDKRFFEADSWLDRILDLHEQASATSDSAKLAGIHRRLFTNFNSLAEYVKLHKESEINRTIQASVSRAVQRYWQPFWDVVPLPLALYDDFLYRYPVSNYTLLFKQEFLRQINEAEFLVRAKALKSRRIARNSERLIELLNKSRAKATSENKN